jgi:hypothetical protein
LYEQKVSSSDSDTFKFRFGSYDIGMQALTVAGVHTTTVIFRSNMRYSGDGISDGYLNLLSELEPITIIVADGKLSHAIERLSSG